MKKTFIETSAFTDQVQRHMNDLEYAVFQRQLMENPEQGTVIPGCGGLRKVRIGDPRRRKGKHGGSRVIYLHIPEADWIFLLDIYSKDEQDDLIYAERKILKQLVAVLKRQAIAVVEKERRENQHD